VPGRGVIICTLAAWGSSPQAGHIGFGPGFVQENQRMRIQRAAATQPALACSGYARALLLTGAECLSCPL
jgi:hypothetical protein